MNDGSLPISVDPLAAVVALAALLLSVVGAILTILEFRRNRKAIFKIIQAEAHMGASFHGANLVESAVLRVTVQNLGRSIHGAVVTLDVDTPKAHGRTAIQLEHVLPRTDHVPSPHQGEFGYGMTGDFALTTAQWQGPFDRLTVFKRAPRGNVFLSIHAQGYLVKRFRVGGRIDMLKHRWNERARRINGRFDAFYKPSGADHQYLRRGKVVPLVPELLEPVRSFGRYAEMADPQSVAK